MSLNMKKINLVKIILDIVMSVLLVLMFNKNVISLNFHEIGGLILCLFILIHTLLNRKWIVDISKKLFSKALSPKLKLCYIIDILLIITLLAIMVSGIFISKIVFTGIWSPGGNWKAIHYFASALSLILAGLHIGLHWNFVMIMFKKHIKLPAIIAKPLSIILVIAVVLFGSYSMFTSSFSMWLTAPFTLSQMEGGQRPSDFNLKDDGSNLNTGKMPPDQNGDKSLGKGERPNGDAFPQKGDRIPQDGQGFPGGGRGGRGEHGGSSNVFIVIATFISIIGAFATITYYCEKLLKSRKKPTQEIIQN